MQTKDSKGDEQPPSMLPQDRYNQLWMVPLARNPYFTGREAELQEINTDLRTPEAGALAISAAGGSGKTQLALEYAFRHREEYRSVFWVPAFSRATLSGAYSDMAMLLDLPGKEQQEHALIVRAAIDWLASQRDWLLILDDAGDFALLKDFLPDTFAGHLLLTTRNGTTGKFARRIRLKKLNPDEGCQFLLRRCGLVSAADKPAPPEVQKQAGEVVAELDGLPLALDLAGSYIAATSCGLPGYLALLRRNYSDSSHRKNEAASKHTPGPVEKTLRLAHEKIAKTNSAALDLLRLCAFFAPDEILETLLVAGAPVLNRSLQKLVSSASRRNTALNLLQKYALIARDPAVGAVIMQREVQSALHAIMPDEVERTWAEQAVRVVGSIFPSLDISNWEACQRLLPHAQACVPLLDRWQLKSIEGAWLLHHAGWYLHTRGDYAQAQACEEQALAIYRALLGDEHPSTAMILNNLAVTYEDRGKLKEAALLHQQALAIRRSTLGVYHPDTVTSLSSLASLYQEQGKLEQAASLYREALASQRQILGDEHPDIAASLVRLAELSRQQENFAEAETLYQQALAIRRKALGRKHSETLAIMSGLAEVYQSQNSLDKAESLLRQVLSIQHKALGHVHLDVATTLQSLAKMYQAQDRLDDAAFWLQQSLAIQREVLGNELPDPARMLETLAIAYEEQEQGEKAEALYQQALTIYRKMPAENRPDIARCSYNLALLYQEQKYFAEARTLLEQALANWQEHSGPEHADTRKARAKYEQLLQKIKETRAKHIPKTEETSRENRPGLKNITGKMKGLGRRKQDKSR